MKRIITIEMDLTDKQVNEIIPSVGVWVEITATQGAVEGPATLIKMEDNKGD